MISRDPYTFVNQDAIPKSIVEPIVTLLKSWDMSRTDYKYVSMFKPDGVLHVLSEPAKGREAIRLLHDSMIDADKGPVVDLQHYLDRLFLMPGVSSTKAEVVFTGTLKNVLVDGQFITNDFATWMVLSKSEVDSGALQVEYLRVFSDTSELSSAIANLPHKKGA